MDDIIQIKCPFDGALLSVRNQPGIETKSVTCPICHQRYPFKEFRRVGQNVDSTDPATTVAGFASPNQIVGCLRIVGTDICFQLKPGLNVIGRKCNRSGADFQIDTGTDRMMSREHILVDVRNVPVKGIVHYVSLFKEQVNKTFVGDEPLLYGDSVVLRDHDIVRLPGAELLFVLPDSDATEYKK